MRKRNPDRLEREFIQETLARLKETNPEFFPHSEEKEEKEKKKQPPLVDQQKLFKSTKGGLRGELAYDPLCKSLAALFYASSKNYSHSNKCLLEYNDYLQEARYKIVWLVAHEKDERTFKKSVINHLRDYRSASRRQVGNFSEVDTEKLER